MISGHKFEVKPEDNKTKSIRRLVIYIGVSFIVFSLVLSLPVFIAFGIIMIIVVAFIPEKHMSVDNELIIIESKFIISALNDTTQINLKDVDETYFVKGQFNLRNIFGTLQASVDLDCQKVLTEDKIVLISKGKKPITIYKIGNAERFKEAFNVIKSITN